MSGIQEDGAAAPPTPANADEEISLVQVPQPGEPRDAVMTDAPAERRTITPVPLPQFPRPTSNAIPTASPAPKATTPTPATNGATAPTPNQTSTSAPRGSSPMPARTGTPRGGAVNGTGPPAEQATVATLPTEATPHGAPVRQYLNSKVTKVLMEGMKVLAKEQPADPLRQLGEYLLQRSKELEGTS